MYKYLAVDDDRLPIGLFDSFDTLKIYVDDYMGVPNESATFDKYLKMEYSEYQSDFEGTLYYNERTNLTNSETIIVKIHVYCLYEIHKDNINKQLTFKQKLDDEKNT